MATKKATAPTFSGPPSSYTNYNPSKQVVVVTAVPRATGGYGYTPTYASTVPPASYSGGATPVSAPKTTAKPAAPPTSGAFSSPVASPYITPAPPITAAVPNLSPKNQAELAGQPGATTPTGSLADALGLGGGNVFSNSGQSLADTLGIQAGAAGNLFVEPFVPLASTPQPSPTITKGAVDYNNLQPATPAPSNQDITRVANQTGYPGPIIGFNPDGTPMYGETDWWSTYGSSAPQGTTGILPPLAYSTPPGTEVPPWEKTRQDWTLDPLQNEEPVPPDVGGGGGGVGGGGGGWGGGGYPDYSGYASSMGLFNWRIGL